MTHEEFLTRAQLEKALAAQAATTPIDRASVGGCLMAAVAMGHTIDVPLKELQALLAEEHGRWVEYLQVKRAVLAQRKAKGGKK